MASFNDRVLRCIPAEVYLISSSQDHETSNEAYNTGAFELPDPAGKAGGACTSSILHVLYSRGHEVGKMSWVEVLKDMHGQLKEQQLNQVPQLSSSRLINVHQPMFIVPPKSGIRRAMLIGVNYVGQKGELKACHNDVENMKDYLIKAQGFRETEILMLKDDGKHTPPTKKNIMDGFVRLTQYSQPGDVVFVSFSGHGGRVADESGDEADGFDESIIPLDFREEGQIVDDDILKYFVKRFKGGVTCTVVMDCCHSGSVMDLPYYFSADSTHMDVEKRFQFGDGADGPKVKKVVGADGKVTSKADAQKKQEEIDGKPKRTVAEKPIKQVLPRKPNPHKPTPPPPPQRCVIQ